MKQITQCIMIRYLLICNGNKNFVVSSIQSIKFTNGYFDYVAKTIIETEIF